jgi:hypothetical protein
MRQPTDTEHYGKTLAKWKFRYLELDGGLDANGKHAVLQGDAESGGRVELHAWMVVVEEDDVVVTVLVEEKDEVVVVEAPFLFILDEATISTQTISGCKSTSANVRGYIVQLYCLGDS